MIVDNRVTMIETHIDKLGKQMRYIEMDAEIVQSNAMMFSIEKIKQALSLLELEKKQRQELTEIGGV